MKRCPECRRDYYDETLLYCLDDGNALLDGPATGKSEPPVSAGGQFDEPATAIMDRQDLDSDSSIPERATEVFDTGALILREIRGHKMRSVLIALAGLLVLAGFGYGIYKFLERPMTPEPVRSSANITTQRLSGDGRTRSPVISPDGKFMVFVKLEGGQQSLWIKQIQTGSAVNVVKPGESDGFFGITFSPDGQYVYYNAGGRTAKDAPTVFRVPTLGGTPVKFLSNAFFIQFSRDGGFCSFRRSDIQAIKESIYIANADGSKEREITSRTGKQFFTTAAAWSPDGKTLAVGLGDDALFPGPLVIPGIISVDDGKIIEIGTKKWELLDDIVWHPSGDSLLMIASENSFLTAQVWELSYPDANPRKLTNNLNGHHGVALTGDGNSLVTGELFSRSSVWVSPDLNPENAKQIMPASGDTWGIAWTPDGRIVYSSDHSGDAQIWIMNSDGSDANQLTNDRGPRFVPAVSPDGRYVVHASPLNGGEIVRIDISGGDPRVLANDPGADNPHVSPDGKWVLYSAFIAGVSRVLRVPIDGGDSEILTPDRWATEPRYSNTGGHFACFVLDEKASIYNKLAIYPAEGIRPLHMLDVPNGTNHVRGPVWTPDDKNIMVIFSPGEKQNLWQIPLDGSPGKQMSDLDVPGIARREYSPDGKRIAIVRGEGFGNALMIAGFR